jgi:hypothetical protein
LKIDHDLKMMSEETETKPTTSEFAPSQESIEKCTNGLVEKFESPVRGINVSELIRVIKLR